MAACLAGGPSAAASHLAAAAICGAEQVTAGRVEITTFDNRPHRLPDAVMHRSRLDPDRFGPEYNGARHHEHPLAVTR